MQYAVIAHRYWNNAGGGELVCAAVAKAFEFLNFTPVLVSPVRIDVSRYPDWFGIKLDKYPRVDTRVNLMAFGIYLRFFVWKPILNALKRFNARIVFIDESTYKPITEKLKRMKVKLIEYIHFPIEVSFRREFIGTGLYYKEDPYFMERYSRFPMNIYFKLYLKILPRYLRPNPFDYADLVLANSRWTADLARKVYGDTPEVLNPPIPPNITITSSLPPYEERINSVVMVGRFGEEKRYHWVIKEVFPRLKKEISNVKLYIFGSTRTRTARTYYSRLLLTARRLGFRVSTSVDTDADIYLIENAHRKLINTIMDRSKVFLHATVNEHWGIAVAEAMARGLPVVVHKSGGAWTDLAEEGAYGLGYQDPDEAAEMITKILTNKSVFEHFSRKGIEKAKHLTLDKFIEKFFKLLEKHNLI